MWQQIRENTYTSRANLSGLWWLVYFRFSLSSVGIRGIRGMWIAVRVWMVSCSFLYWTNNEQITIIIMLPSVMPKQTDSKSYNDLWPVELATCTNNICLVNTQYNKKKIFIYKSLFELKSHWGQKLKTYKAMFHIIHHTTHVGEHTVESTKHVHRAPKRGHHVLPWISGLNLLPPVWSLYLLLRGWSKKLCKWIPHHWVHHVLVLRMETPVKINGNTCTTWMNQPKNNM